MSISMEALAQPSTCHSGAPQHSPASAAPQSTSQARCCGMNLAAADAWAQNLAYSARDSIVGAKDALAELMGPAVVQPAWQLTEAVCAQILAALRLFLLYGANPTMRKHFIYDYNDWPEDRGPKPSPDWRRQALCPDLQALGIEDSEVNCNVSGRPASQPAALSAPATRACFLSHRVNRMKTCLWVACCRKISSTTTGARCWVSPPSFLPSLSSVLR